MSSTIIPQIGSVMGGAIAGPIGSAIGHGAATIIGQEFENRLTRKRPAMLGPRLMEISLQTASYGKMIPIVYGTAKLAGNIIWASEIKEDRHNHYRRRGKSGGRSVVATEFTYRVSLAIAICEGEVNEIQRVWVNDKLIDARISSYRFYSGSEAQLPDPLIESIQGIGYTPAFRGLCYIVIEDLPLSEFSNHVPNFLFEVKRKVKTHNADGGLPLEERIKSMVMIPGSGEFVYDTQVQSKVPENYNPNRGEFNLRKTKINQNNRENMTDSLLSLNQLGDTCPNLEWVAPVVGWFTQSIDAKNSTIHPGVEYRDSSTLPDQWKVGKYDRNSAHLISKNKYSSPIYGGTSNDLSILRYLDELKRRNYKIMFYPMLFVDKYNKPWRGRISGNPESVEKFFSGPEGYNKFILHYASLVKDKVDAFIIGSEMIGLTKIRDENNHFPAVNALVNLAKEVKKIMGPNVKISYAADWSEYHHTEHGWYNLDKLWACDYIDFIGIDAYFPLTNTTQNFYNEERIIKGWESGEGWDYYYSDQNKLKKKELDPAYAWKNIRYWWENEHFNPDHSKTEWKPKQKKIWFTELGFPSIDLSSNQPNVFYSPDSVESNFPIHSKGRVDFVAQRQALSATEKYWKNSEFLEQMFIWTWDARPFPYWPDLKKIWTDGGCWSRGHWVNGKLGLIKLEAVVQDLCKRSGIDITKVRAEELYDLVDGFVIQSSESAKEVINLLKSAYFFDSHEENGNLCFVKRLDRTATKINAEDLVSNNGHEEHSLNVTKLSPSELANSIEIHYINYLFDYQLAVEFSTNYCYPTLQKMSLHLPITLDPQKAKTIAEITLQEVWQEQFIYNFTLLPQYIEVRPNDIIHLKMNNKNIAMRVINTEISRGRVNKVTAVSIKENLYQQQAQVQINQQSTLLNKDHFDPGETDLIILSLPKLPYDLPPYGIYLGVMASDSHWRGAEVVCPDSSNLFFKYKAVAGIIESQSDESIHLLLLNGELDSKNEKELERYANLAVIGNEIIQFATAEFLGNHKYKLSEIKREMFDSKKNESDKFVLLDESLQKCPISEQQIGKEQEFITISAGHGAEQEKKFIFTYN
jgi:hypothetical protein